MSMTLPSSPRLADTAQAPTASSAPGAASPVRWLLLAGGLSLLLRFVIAARLPVTGDEAFFYWWGVFPDWGYSDHPPMVGWLIWLMRSTLGDTLLAIRLPVLLLPLGVGAALWWAFSPIDRVRTAWGILFFWLTPLNWLNTLITTDTPLIFWSACAVAALVRAECRPRLDAAARGLYALSGVFLGCAFLSKYFAVVLGLACLAYFVMFRRDRLAAFALLVLCSLPGPAINIAYNMSHGWTNIMFNLFNRNQGAAFELSHPLTYLLMMAYLITPPALLLLFRHRHRLSARAASSPGLRLLACVVVVPLLFFLLLSAAKLIGLHWVMAFYAFGFVWLAFALPADVLRRCAAGMAVFAALHVGVVAALFTTTLETWRTTPVLSGIYPEVVRSYRAAEIVRQVQSPGAVLMAEAYTAASIYGFARRQYMPVFGVGRFHARQDDQLVDFSVYQGKTIRVLLSGEAVSPEYSLYFDSVRAFSIEQDGAPVYLMEGVNFDYAAYKQGVLGEIHNRFYEIPGWLPMTGCPFCKRYCGQARCGP